jgi:chromosome segregation ATPase
MRRIDIFVSSPEDVQKERSLVERTIRAVADEFSVPITVTYSNWLRQHVPLDKIAVPGANGSEDGRTWLCPCFWEYRDTELDQEYREQIPNTGSYDLVISIIWSRLGSRLSPAFVMPDGSQPKVASEYEIGWVLDQVNRTPGFPELRVYRNGAAPSAPLHPKTQREAFFRDWDAVQEFFAVWEKQKTFAEACSRYSDLQEFENLFRTHFRDFLGRQLEKEIVPRKPVLRVNRTKTEPFRGLRFFNFEDAPIFHGRTKAVGQVLDALGKQASAKTPFVLVLGASGSGKSSLVRAGVLPLLTEIGTMAGEGPWRYAITRPGSGGDPFDSLASALLENTALPELKRARKRDNWRDLAADLKETPAKVALELTEMIDRISVQELDHLLDREKDQKPVPGRIESTELARHRRLRRVKPKAKIALFIDQLEELFTNDFSLELQHQYLSAVSALVRSERVYVIAALGSDYYTAYQEFPELVALTAPSGRFDLQSPTREELGRMVRAPAETYGLSFDRQAKTGQALDDALIEAALVSADQLPLLEHLLWLLYRKQVARDDGVLRWSDYLELGKLDGALAHHGESVFTTLSSEARQAFDFVLRRLAPVELDQKGSCRTALYRDLVASGGIDNRLQGGAKELVDSMVKEGLLISETDFRHQEVVSVAHPALLRKWPRVREWLIEDQEFLRMRDRLDGCLKLWLKRGRKRRDLLTPGLGLADGETLLNHFHSSLSNAQIEYIQKSLADQKRGRRVRYLFWLPLVAVLVSLAAFFEFRWFNNESLRTSMQEFGSVERKFTELVKADRGGSQAELLQAQEKAQSAQHDAELAAAQRSAMESQLKQAQENASLALARQGAFEIQLKQAQDKFQQGQLNAEQASSQRAALETQLKQAQDKLQQASQSTEQASSQRAALETQLKQAQDKLQQASQSTDLAFNQRGALEAQLKQAQDKLQQASQNADLASSQRGALEAQLKQAEDKIQEVQKNADLSSSQRAALETQLKQAQDKLQEAQKNADLASSQRVTLDAQLKQAQDKLQEAQKNADLSSSQRATLDAQLKQAQDKLQVAQKNADLSSSQRATLDTQLKQAQDKLQEAQKNADLSSSQRAILDTQLKQAQDKVQEAQKNGDLASSQHAALETQLKQTQDKLQQAQKNADLASGQRAVLDIQLEQAQDKLNEAQKNGDLVSSQYAALEIQLKQAQDKLQLAQKNADSASSQRAALETQAKQTQDKLQQAQKNVDLVSSQRAALETQLKQAQDKLQQLAEPASNQRAALETQLKQAQDKLQEAQQSADLASSQRAGLESQLKQAQVDLHQAQQNADLASSQRITLETQVKQTQDKLQQTQQNADLASSQRAALETQLKQAEDKFQQASQNADLVSNQRGALEAQLKQSQDRLQQAQKNTDLAFSQRAALETQLKQAEDKLQQTQQNADLASSQRAALETQLKDARAKLKQTQDGADFASNQRAALEAQLKDAQGKLKQAQDSADLASNQRAGLEAQLKDVQGKLQNAELASNERATLETQLKQTRNKLQQAQQNAELASDQSAALGTQLKEAQDKLQQAQQNADLALSQRAALDTQLREAEQKAQLAQKIADLVAAQAHPEQNETSKESAARKNGRSSNQLGSGRALPLDAGRNPEPGTSTQPLIAPVQSPGH